MEAPKYEAPPPDPTVVALNERAKNDQLSALQNSARMDTAALMARYGTTLALAGSVAPSSAPQSFTGVLNGR